MYFLLAGVGCGWVFGCGVRGRALWLNYAAAYLFAIRI